MPPRLAQFLCCGAITPLLPCDQLRKSSWYGTVSAAVAKPAIVIARTKRVRFIAASYLCAWPWTGHIRTPPARKAIKDTAAPSLLSPQCRQRDHPDVFRRRRVLRTNYGAAHST